jgi:hypothetical protein|tara:strand:+ start:23223 stop:23432 length:210 start_codon:yes stop_codon:yes gene_type:complete
MPLRHAIRLKLGKYLLLLINSAACAHSEHWVYTTMLHKAGSRARKYNDDYFCESYLTKETASGQHHDPV